MNVIKLKDLRENMIKYSEMIQNGESFVVFKRSKPLFKIVPVEDEKWEEVVDFTKIQKGGVDIKEVLKRL